LANCVSCGVSNLGIERSPLVIVDGEWYCEDCLPKKKGRVRCHQCGKEPFGSDNHFKMEQGQFLCTECMEKAGIMKKYDYIMQSIAKTTGFVKPPSAGNDIAAGLGGLRILLDQNLSPGETVTYAIQGNAGEALACSKANVFILKSGMAVGSITGRKCCKFPWEQIRSVDLKLGNLYGVLEVTDGRMPAHDANDIAKAKKADNAITFLLSRKSEFDQAVNNIQSYLHR
jgi:hypothetical protein